VLDEDRDPPQRGGGELEEIWPSVDPIRIAGMAERRDFKIVLTYIECWVP